MIKIKMEYWLNLNLLMDAFKVKTSQDTSLIKNSAIFTKKYLYKNCTSKVFINTLSRCIKNWSD